MLPTQYSSHCRSPFYLACWQNHLSMVEDIVYVTKVHFATFLTARVVILDNGWEGLLAGGLWGEIFFLLKIDA